MPRPEKHWRLGYTSDFDLDFYWISCAISDVKMPEFLMASHIKPWRDSSNYERLDPFNSILLDDSSILIGRYRAQQLKREPGVHSSMKLRRVDKHHAPYLSWHRANVFKC
ncbi:MAG: HNH endonuclease [Candidatus Nitrosoglobus sp.]|jgi:hypothetical protein